MAYDEELAARIRLALGERADFEEIKMFGGLAFMVNTHMACGVIREDLMLRVGKENHADALRARRARRWRSPAARCAAWSSSPVPRSQMPTTFDGWIDEAVAYAQGGPAQAVEGGEVLNRKILGSGGEGGARTHDPRIMSPLL